ncbi:MAG: transcription elongation factor GreA [Planctomycetes bacterium]|nr:transcription elongation factor GreA [Planctomycetota bacterium]
MSDRVPMTQDAYNRIKAEVEELENVEMPKITEKIAEARAEGDLKENAEYHAQRENQGMLQARINEKKSQLGRALIIDISKVDKSQISFGATVTVKDLDFDDEEDFTLVGEGDEDYDSGKIKCTSPIGQGLLGLKVGEVAEIAAPKGTIKFEVVSIRYE